MIRPRAAPAMSATQLPVASKVSPCDARAMLPPRNDTVNGKRCPHAAPLEGRNQDISGRGHDALKRLTLMLLLAAIGSDAAKALSIQTSCEVPHAGQRRLR